MHISLLRFYLAVILVEPNLSYVIVTPLPLLALSIRSAILLAMAPVVPIPAPISAPTFGSKLTHDACKVPKAIFRPFLTHWIASEFVNETVAFPEYCGGRPVEASTLLLMGIKVGLIILG